MKKENKYLLGAIIFAVFTVLFMIIQLLFFSGCNGHPPPVIPPEPSLPEVCLEFTPKYGYGWIDFSPKNRWIVVSHWQDVDPDKHGNQKAIEVWQYDQPGDAPELIWETVWTGPLDYLSYPGFGEQGPLVLANVKGGDGGRDELCFVDYSNTSYWLNIIRINNDVATFVQRKKIPTYLGREVIAMDLLAINASVPSGSRYSDLVVCYRHYGKVTKALYCYTAPALNLKWSRWFTEDGTPAGRFNDRWVCHRPEVIHWPNGKDCLWLGISMIDWDGGGQLGDPSYQNYPIEFNDMNMEDDYVTHHWDSCCYFPRQGGGVPRIISTEDGPRIWLFNDLYSFVREDGNKYWMYRWLGLYSKGHTHRLRTLNDNLFITTNVDHDDNTDDRVICISYLTMKEQWSKKTRQEAEVIEWDGNHESKEILTDYAILSNTGRVLKKRNGPTKLENNFHADLWIDVFPGHEQYFEEHEGRIRAIANTEAEKNLPVKRDVNASFY